MSIRSQFLSGLKWTVLGRVASQLSTWVVTIYVMRLVGPADYGLMAIAAIFSALFVLVSEMGLGSSVVRSKDIGPRQLQQVFGIVLLTKASVCAITVFAVAPLAALFFGETRLEGVLQVTALQFIPAAFAVVPAALLTREMEFQGRAIIDFSASFGGALVTLGLAHFGYGVFALAWGSVATAAIRAVGLNLLSPRVGLPVFRFAGCGALFNFGRNVAQTQLVWFVYSQADAFIAGKILGKHDLGVYSVSMDLASLPASRISGILNQVVFPTLSKIQREGGTLAAPLLKGIRGLSLVSFPAMWGLSSVAPELVPALLGPKWLEAVVPLTLLCLIMPLRVLSPLMHNGLYAVGRADVSFRITCITALVMCTAFLVGTGFGLLGLSLAWAIVFPLVFLYNLVTAGRHFGLNAREILAALLRPALASGLMYACIALLRASLPDPALLRLVLLIATGAAAYTAFSLAINREGLREAWQLLFRPRTSA